MCTCIKTGSAFCQHIASLDGSQQTRVATAGRLKFQAVGKVLTTVSVLGVVCQTCGSTAVKQCPLKLTRQLLAVSVKCLISGFCGIEYASHQPLRGQGQSAQI